jgi:hypothetical protein
LGFLSQTPDHAVSMRRSVKISCFLSMSVDPVDSCAFALIPFHLIPLPFHSIPSSFLGTLSHIRLYRLSFFRPDPSVIQFVPFIHD